MKSINCSSDIVLGEVLQFLCHFGAFGEGPSNGRSLSLFNMQVQFRVYVFTLFLVKVLRKHIPRLRGFLANL